GAAPPRGNGRSPRHRAPLRRADAAPGRRVLGDRAPRLSRPDRRAVARWPPGALPLESPHGPGRGAPRPADHRARSDRGRRGTAVWEADGNRLVDFSSQLVNTNIGHTHPKVVAAIQAQAAILPTVAPAHANRVRGLAAERILEVAGEPFSQVFFTNGGADANENAIRLARLVTGRDKVLSAYRSYHGNTGAAIAATGDWRRI